jgi:hypothetical protein
MKSPSSRASFRFATLTSTTPWRRGQQAQSTIKLKVPNSFQDLTAMQTDLGAIVPVALVGVSPTSPIVNSPSPIGEDSSAEKAFGETPKAAVETTALPKTTASFRLRI